MRQINNKSYLHVISHRSRRGPLSTLPRSRFLCLVQSASPSMLLLALANSPIRRLAMNSRITKSRTIWSSERSLSSCKQQLCLFAYSTSLPAPSRAVCTWYSHMRGQPNNASCCCQSKIRTYSAKKPMNHNAEFSLSVNNKNNILFLSVPDF